jgi:hypothetical protein
MNRKERRSTTIIEEGQGVIRKPNRPEKIQSLWERGERRKTVTLPQRVKPIQVHTRRFRTHSLDLKKSPRKKEDKVEDKEEKVSSPREKRKKGEDKDKEEDKKKKKREKENGAKPIDFELGWDFSAMEKLCVLLRDDTHGIMKWKDVGDTFTRKLC